MLLLKDLTIKIFPVHCLMAISDKGLVGVGGGRNGNIYAVKYGWGQQVNL